ncbi:MAG: DUF3150 domain-containing protein [Deltaproteobacteria bacterium]|nr:DUF3150 domain-containing protein [Deltaproteobacteria bacterium]
MKTTQPKLIKERRIVMENMFEKGCLVQLSISKWGGVKKINDNQLAEMIDSHEWVTATKKLVDPESLKPICKMGNAARTYLTTVSLPFPIQGMVFIPKEMISRVDQRLEEFKTEFNDTVTAFLRDYDRLRETAMVYLGELFNEVDYPLHVEKKFSFAWRFIILDVPNGKSGILSPEVYEREKEKFIQTMEEARTMAIESLREEFASMVERITERFTQNGERKPKIFKNSTIESFYEFFETFKERNIFKDAELAELVERAQAVLGGVSPESIRTSDLLKENIHAGMAEIENAMAVALARPRRKIVMN